jgi:hypothetical protein
MNKQQYAELVEKELDTIKQIVKAKNNDYTASSGSAFANFESTPDLASPFSGVLIRMGDKFQRLRTFAAKGQLQVAGEGADDAARDVIGYALILLGMLADAKEAPVDRNSCVTEELKKVAGWREQSRGFIQNGKRYKSRSGKIYGPLFLRKADDLSEEAGGCPEHIWTDGVEVWRSDGSWQAEDRKPVQWDLVEEVPEEKKG